MNTFPGIEPTLAPAAAAAAPVAAPVAAPAAAAAPEPEPEMTKTEIFLIIMGVLVLVAFLLFVAKQRRQISAPGTA